MEKIYIFGHRNPDTDSITSAIALEYIKKVQGFNAEARALGELNDETKFVLNHFNVKEPRYLNDVRIKIKDIKYYKDFFLNKLCSILDTYDFIVKNNVTGVPIVDDDNSFMGLVTAKTILKNLFNDESNKLVATYDNILKILNGEEIVRADDAINGLVSAVSYKSTTFLETVKLTKEDILVVGDRHSIIESAVNSGVRLIVISGNQFIKEEHINIAKKNNVNIIRTPYDTFKAVKKILLSNSVETLLCTENPVTVFENEYFDEFLEKAKKLGFNNYPVLDKNRICKGMIRLSANNKANLKKVILVDHSEKGQSAEGIEEAEITEIVDHHNLGNITTSSPLNFRGMAVGSTNTIMFYLFNENGILIPKHIAGIMLGGILSDTLALTSPTTTDIDRKVVKKLEEISGENYKEFAKEMFAAGSDYKDKTEDDLINIDIKLYQGSKKSFKVSQIVTPNVQDIIERKEKIIETLVKMKEEAKVDFILFYVTDILSNGSYLFYTKGCESMLEKMYEKEIKQGMYIEDCVSRKKQVIPLVMEFEEE